MRLIFLLFFFSFINVCLGQDQKKADSLISVLNHTSLDPMQRLHVLDGLALHSSDPAESIRFANQLLDESKKRTSRIHEIKAYFYLGVSYRFQGDLERSLSFLLKSVGLAVEEQQFDQAAEAYLEVANTYTSGNQFRNALIYENKAIKLIQKYGTREQLAINLLNTGYSYYTLSKLDSALLLYDEATKIFDSLNMAIGTAYTIGNRALVYWRLGDLATAKIDLQRAIDMLRPLGDRYGMSDYHNQMARLCFEQQLILEAIKHATLSLQMSQELGLKEQIRDASLLLSELYESEEDYFRAFYFQKQYGAYKDSVENIAATKRMADLRTEYEVSLKENEIDLLHIRNKTYVIVGVVLLVFAFMLLLYLRQRLITTRLMAERERERNDEKIEDLLRKQESSAIQSMILGREQERKRIAAELHNHLGSLLATIKVNLNAFVDEDLPNHDTLTKLVDQACNDVRGMSHSLNMGVSDDFGLVPALRDLVTNLEKTGSISVELNTSMNNCHLDSNTEIVLYRIIQELVSNILKHANASKLAILLTCFPVENLLNIIVQDNGIGFDPNLYESGSNQGGMGLQSIRNMVGHRNGEISFDSHPTSGTTINIDWPLDDEMI